MATIPEVAAAGIRRRTRQAAERGAADGLAFRQAPHERGAWRRTGRRNSPSFEHHPAAAASLGQVHRARSLDGAQLACKLQYPDMQSAVEADLRQLEILFAIHRRMEPAIDTREIAKEIGARIREELDYRREAKHAALYRAMLADAGTIRVPRVVAGAVDRAAAHPDWLDGRQLLAHKDATPRAAQPARHGHVHRLVVPVQPLRRDPRRPASRQLHGLRGRRRAGRHQPARLWLHPHLSAELRRRRGRSLPRPSHRRRRARRSRLRDLGFQASSTAT